jgi:hypothetical protein
MAALQFMLVLIPGFTEQDCISRYNWLLQLSGWQLTVNHINMRLELFMALNIYSMMCSLITCVILWLGVSIWEDRTAHIFRIGSYHNFTFMWLCILADFLVIKPTRCTNFSNLFWKWNSTCFIQFLCPSSGVIHCTLSDGICHTDL